MMGEHADLMETVARRILGEPNLRMSTEHQLRFGNNGSLAVNVSGPHRGTFTNFECNVSGGVLDLIVSKRGGDRKSAQEWMRHEFGDVSGRPETEKRVKITATYSYQDKDSACRLEVVRLSPKGFRQRRPAGDGKYIWDAKGVTPLIYHLPEIDEGLSHNRPIFVVEGEKDADALRDLGFLATCNPGGAGKWTSNHAAFLAGADVIILPDNDKAGQKHAETVATTCAEAGARVRLVNLPGLDRKGDPSDWIRMGGTAEQLNALVDDAPDWQPPANTIFPVCWWGDEDNFPPRDWLVKGVLAQGELSVLFAPSGGGKSFVALDIGARIAHGFDWFGHPTTRGPVVYVAGEGATGFVGRMKAWRQEYGSAQRVPFVLTPKILDLRSSETDTANLIKHVRQISRICGQPVRLIVIDTLSRMLGGGTDADPRDMAGFLTLIERLREETDSHIMIVHHTGKETQRGMRGSSTLRDSADTAIEISKNPDGDIFTATIEKQKDGEDGKTFTFKLAKSVLGQDEDGDDITSCVIDPIDANAGESRQTVKLTDSEKTALKALKAAIMEMGQPAPDGAIPKGTMVVDVEDWRDYAYRSGISSSDEHAAKRKAFGRARQSLSDKGFISQQEHYVWPT